MRVGLALAVASLALPIVTGATQDEVAHVRRDYDNEQGVGQHMNGHHHGSEIHGGLGANPNGSPSASSATSSDSQVGSAPEPDPLPSSVTTPASTPPDAHSHGHGRHKPVKTILDDADIHRFHKFPITYLDMDWGITNETAIFGEEFPEDWNPADAPSHPRLMIAHVSLMVLAYFGLLPISLALRAADHSIHYLANTVFIVVALLGWITGVAYKAEMPDLYEGAIHGRLGTILVFLSVALAILDSLNLFAKAIQFCRSGRGDWRGFIRDAIHSTGRGKRATGYEMVGLVAEPEEMNEDDGDEIDRMYQTRPHLVFALGDDESTDGSRQPTPAQFHRIETKRDSTGSDGTLHDSPTSSNASTHRYDMDRTSSMSGHIKFQSSRNAGAFDDHTHHVPAWIEAPLDDLVVPPKSDEAPTASRVTLKRFGQIILTWIRRSQVVFAYVVLLTGIPVYTGMCRAGFINTCAAHFIKGSIFFGYGVLTFGRYLGAWADLGWAWNRRPSASKAVSAEMIECFVIFLYGITNTWMERFGSKAGDPYTVKQVQHISIAVMFWFAGMSGMLLESPTIRRTLGAVLYSRKTASRGGSGSTSEDEVPQPPSYAFSFNPLPALTIAVTGLAMAAHHQDYAFQVSIHSLWGMLLAGGSLCRFLTYFFLWIRPPVESTLPSRPPTEVLTSFGWAAGGIVFCLSDEEIAYAAMRSGFDDMMAFLNVTVAVTCMVFCWIVVVLAIKGYAVFRRERGVRLAEGDDEARA